MTSRSGGWELHTLTCTSSVRPLRKSDSFLLTRVKDWPVAFAEPATKENGNKPRIDWDLTRDPTSVWQALEECVKKGKAKHIGISNFTVEKAQKLYDAAKIKPAVNQVELSLGCWQNDLFEVRGGLVSQNVTMLTWSRETVVEEDQRLA